MLVVLLGWLHFCPTGRASEVIGASPLAGVPRGCISRMAFSLEKEMVGDCWKCHVKLGILRPCSPVALDLGAMGLLTGCRSVRQENCTEHLAVCIQLFATFQIECFCLSSSQVGIAPER